MPRFSPEDLAVWTGGRWTSQPGRPITAVVHDTRAMEDGALYVALSGENYDGHAFLSEAESLGAVAGMCERGRGIEELACLEVADPLRALGELARNHRRRFGGLVVGVTGSAGKSTVKELLAEMLSRRGDTCKTQGNWNNEIGLPLSMLKLKESDDFGVFEVGMNRPGEIGPLAEMMGPVCGVITSIGAAHMQAFGSLEGIAREKAALLEVLPEEGAAVIDLDSPWAGLFREVTRARVVSCSLETEADYAAILGEAPAGRVRIRDRRHGKEFELSLPLPGRHMIRNLLLAVAVAREFGLRPEEIEAGVQQFAPPPMRWERVRMGRWTVINDAYNANPLSMRSAIKTFAGLERPVEKWLVLGGMSELGEEEARAHRELGEFIGRYGFRGVVCVGELARGIAETAKAEEVRMVENVEEAVEQLKEKVGPGAGILLKASRVHRLERILLLLEEHSGGNPTT